MLVNAKAVGVRKVVAQLTEELEYVLVVGSALDWDLGFEGSGWDVGFGDEWGRVVFD
jgi:hypothetical protein